MAPQPIQVPCGNGQTAIAYRYGYYIPPSTGFGHAKVLEKHNMYKPVVAFIVNGPHHCHLPFCWAHGKGSLFFPLESSMAGAAFLRDLGL